MNYFELYEKTKEVRKNLTVGSDWKIIKATLGANGHNTPGRIVRILAVGNNEVRYSYVDVSGEIDDFFHYYRGVDVFKATCAPVV